VQVYRRVLRVRVSNDFICSVESGSCRAFVGIRDTDMVLRDLGRKHGKLTRFKPGSVSLDGQLQSVLITLVQPEVGLDAR
jgi:hypothetical protein